MIVSDIKISNYPFLQDQGSFLKMNEELVSEIQERMKHHSTEKLLQIWVDNDRQEFLDETFEAVRRILVERGEDIPAQQQPVRAAPSSVNPDVVLMRLAVVVASLALGYGGLFLLLIVSGALREEAIACVFIIAGALFSVVAAAPVGLIYGILSPRSTDSVTLELSLTTVHQLIDEYWETRDWDIKWHSEESGVIVTNCLDLRPPKGAWRVLGILLVLWFPLLGMFGGKEIIKVKINAVEEQRSELVVEAQGVLGTTEAEKLLSALQE